MDWLQYLPPVLQAPETYFTLLVCFAVYGLAKSAPTADKQPWLPELASMVIGIGMACGLHVGKSYVYGIGTGFIAAWGASSFYTTAFSWLTAKLRALIGGNSGSSSPETLSPGPGNTLNPSTPPPKNP